MVKSKVVGISMRTSTAIRFVFDQAGELVGHDVEIRTQEEDGRFYDTIITENCTCQLCVSDLEGAGFKKKGTKLYFPEWANEQIRAKLLEFRIDKSLGKEETDG